MSKRKISPILTQKCREKFLSAFLINIAMAKMA